MLHLSMLTTPPPVVVKSYLVASVAFGMTFAVRVVTALLKNTLPITTRSPAAGVNPSVAEPEFPMRTNPFASIHTTFPLVDSVPVVVFVPLFEY